MCKQLDNIIVLESSCKKHIAQSRCIDQEEIGMHSSSRWQITDCGTGL